MKIIIRKSWLSFSLVLALVFTFADCSEKSSSIKIAVNQYVHHPNLSATFKGFQDVVASWAKVHGKAVQYDVQNANGDVSIATQIARQQAAAKPNLILALATPSAQASAKATTSIPIVFGAITDPVAAGLVKSAESPGGNVTGSSDRWPYEKQFELIKKLRPQAQTVGIVLNPGESNTVASMKLIDAALNKNMLKKVEAPVSNTGEIFGAAQSLVGKCEVFFAPADNTVLSGLDAFVKIAQTNQIPLFVGDEGSLLKGGVATYGIDYYQLGQATGEVACKILDGAKPGQIPVVVGTSGRLIINPNAAAKQGLIIPAEILKQAKIVE